MVITRSQIDRTNEKEQIKIITFSDNESNSSSRDIYSNTRFADDNEMNNADQGSDHEKVSIEQQFIDMNCQIGEMTSIVKALTETMTDRREENGQNFQTLGRHDVLTICIICSH